MTTTPSPPHLVEITPPSNEHQKSLFDRLRDSELYRSYRKIFQQVTGLPLQLLPTNPERVVPDCDEEEQNRFCYLLNKGEQKCQQCVLAHRCLASNQERGVHSIACFADLQETVVPVMQGGTLVAQLVTGQVFHQQPSRERFAEITKTLPEDAESDAVLAEAYMETPVVEKEKYQAMVTLLAAFSLQLSELASQLILELRREKSDAIAYAKDYVEENIKDPIQLDEVAAQVNMSPFYFCRKFKEATGMTLTHYVSRRRVDLAGEMLQYTTRRIADIAFEVGFQSLSQFNRSFQKITGQSPTAFRKQAVAA